MKIKPYKFFYLVSIILRIVFPLAIFKFPLFTVVGVTFLDAIDVEFASRMVTTRNIYQRIDKYLDTWWYLMALSFSYFFLNQYFLFLVILFIFRVVGLLVLMVKEDRRILFFAPNLFENAFFLFFFANYFGWQKLITGYNLYYSLIVVFILKLIQEYWLHVLKKSFIEDVFKLKWRKWLPER